MNKKIIISILFLGSNLIFSAQMSDLDRAIAESKKTAAAEAARRAAGQEKINIEIQQLKVLAQQNSDCGFHALKNMSLILNWLNPNMGLNIKDRDAYLNSTDKHVFPLEALRAKCNSKTLISTDEIENLALKFYNIAKNKFSIIQNIYQIKDNLISPHPVFNAINYIDPHLGEAIKKLRTAKRAVHGFIIADGRFEQKANGTYDGIAGHWIAIVVYKENDKIYLYCANSVLSKELHDDAQMAKVLSQIILNAHYDKLSKVAVGKKIKWG